MFLNGLQNIKIKFVQAHQSCFTVWTQLTNSCSSSTVEGILLELHEEKLTSVILLLSWFPSLTMLAPQTFIANPKSPIQQVPSVRTKIFLLLMSRCTTAGLCIPDDQNKAKREREWVREKKKPFVLISSISPKPRPLLISSKK